MYTCILVNLLHDRASQHPDRTAYTFLEDGEHEVSSLTYGQLDEKARAIAAYLQAQLSVGDRVLLVYSQGLEAIAALFGCLYAGVIAIPAPAPETARLKRTLPRLEAIAADAGASLILTTASLLTKRDGNLSFQAKSFVGRIGGRSSLLLHYYLAAAETVQKTSPLATLPWIATETIPAQLAAHWQPPNISGDTLAYLQYTSGSTSTPKGVMLDHANLMGHLAALQEAVGYDSNSVTVTWMPYFHDYGLVEGILEPLYNGTPCYLMSPTAFIKQPLRWLKAISKYGATHSQAPNFAYAYCLKRITTAERETLDLSHWQAAGNAAEPINPEVMAQFCQTFASCGFRPHAFAPAYGLAEATLVVTTSRKADAPVFCTIDGAALAQNRIVETPTGQRLAGSGRVLAETQVVIVHPETLTRCAPDEVGEIWVASVGAARGYWQRPDATQETFCAYLADTKEGAFLRTGDLGFLKDGELFVTGRLKDLIIIRGENYYPQDLEWVVEKSHLALRSSYGAAFAVEVDGVEQVVIAFEVDRGASKNLDVDEVVGAIRHAVAEHYELPIYGIVLLKRGSIPKTSSGKIQRQACRNAFLDGSLNSLAIWTLENPSGQQQGIIPENPLEFQLVQIWQRVLGISSVSTKDNFFELGGDSLKAAIVVAEVEQVFGQTISLVNLAEASTIEKLANFIVQEKREVKLRSLLPIKPTGSKRPFFVIHGLGGYSLAPTLARYLHPERPIHGLQAVGLDGEQAPYTRIEEMVAHYIQEIQTVQSEGPYLLGGLCIGGNIAFEMAQELKKQGQQVLLVAMLDSRNPCWTKEERIEMANSPSNYQLSRKEELMGSGFSPKQIENLFRVQDANYQILTNHIPQVYSGRVVYLSVAEKITLEDKVITQRARRIFDPLQPNGWNSLVADGIEVHEVPGNHQNFFKEPHIQVLAEKLNACLEQTDQDYKAEKVPLTPFAVTEQLIQIWQKVLGISSISAKDNFFELGGDSLKAAVVMAEIGKLIGQEIPLALLATAPTIEQLAFLLCQENKNAGIRSLVLVKPGGSKRPFFYIHGLLGYNSDANFALARHIDVDRPFFGIQAIGVDPQKSPHADVDEMASHYIQEIQTVQPEGPYLVGGVSAGGSIAFEVAQQLQRQGQKVQLLVMVDTSNPYLTEQDLNTLGKQVGLQMPSWAKEIDELWQLHHVEHRSKLAQATRKAIANHLPKVYYGQVVYFAAEESMTEEPYFDPMQPQGWNSLVANGIEIYNVPGNHFTMHYEPHVRVLAEKLNACLEEADHAEDSKCYQTRSPKDAEAQYLMEKQSHHQG